MSRKVKRNDFVGKTVAKVDVSAINCIRLDFTDGSSIMLEAENVGMGLMGIVVSEETKAPKKAA